jgi:pyruvate dehydrogenase E2 component (dihydrolipoamide acetyltransferase)
VPAAPKPQIVVEVETRGRVRASPVARRLAAARGIDLAAITGSGPLGAIILYDL